MTYAELKAALEALTPEQLALDVTWSGEERGGIVKRVWIAQEDWIDNGDGDCEPRSVVEENAEDDFDAKGAHVYIRTGTPHLMVDD